MPKTRAERKRNPTHSISPICGKIELGNRKSPRSLRIDKFTRSWNLSHIVRLKTKRLVRIINEEFSYPVPEIVRPDEI